MKPARLPVSLSVFCPEVKLEVDVEESCRPCPNFHGVHTTMKVLCSFD